MRILITGGAGFIGTTAVRHLLDAGHLVTVLDYMGYGYRKDFGKMNPEAPFIYADAQKVNLSSPGLSEFDLYLIMHSESHVDRSLQNGSLFVESNVLGTVNILEQIKNLGKPVWIFGTDEVLGESVTPLNEDRDYNPRNPYSASKAAQELMAKGYAETFGFPLYITRCTNVYGPGQALEKFIPLSISRLLKGHPIPLYGEGKEGREWTYVGDVAEAIVRIVAGISAGGLASGIYHISGGSSFSNFEMASTLCHLLAKDPNENIQFVPNRKGHDFWYSLSSQKLNQTTGWEAKESVLHGLLKTIEYYRGMLET